MENKRIIIGITIAILLILVGISTAGIDIARPEAAPEGGGGTTTPAAGGTTPAQPTAGTTPASGTSGQTPGPSAAGGGTTTPPAATSRQPQTGVVVGAATFLSAYNQYSGLARFGSLFMTSDYWETYRERVNQAFCDTIILGGTQCWTSRICDTFLYANMPLSMFAGRTPSGQRVATAAIQGEKSLPIAAIDENALPINLWLYKVTYAIRNPYEEQDIRYNVQFRAESGHTFDWYSERQVLAPGTHKAITEDSPLINYGRHDYAQVCLIFNPGIVNYQASWHGQTIREWCTPITQYTGTATRPYPEAANDTTVTPSPGTAPPTTTTPTSTMPGF